MIFSPIIFNCKYILRFSDIINIQWVNEDDNSLDIKSISKGKDWDKLLTFCQTFGEFAHYYN